MNLTRPDGDKEVCPPSQVFCLMDGIDAKRVRENGNPK